MALVLSLFVLLDHKKTLEYDLLYKMHMMADDIIEHKLYENSQDELKVIFSDSEAYHHFNYLESIKNVEFKYSSKKPKQLKDLSIVKSLPDNRFLVISSPSDYIYKEVSMLLWRLAVALILTLGLIIGAFYILLQKLFHPLKCLVEYCNNSTASKGLFDKCSDSYEINALKEAIFELEQRNQLLCKEKQDIFKEAAHEIKTPIAILKARVSLF